MPRVAVVTDSTAYLPAGIAEKYDITVVPLQVVLDGRVALEGRDVTPAEVAAALAARRTVSTSRPAPAALQAAYDGAREAGASAVVSVHLSSELSGTVEAARLAAGDVAGVDVVVVDSRSTTMGLGFAVIDAAEAAAAGQSAGEVAEAAAAAAANTRVLFCLRTLEFLRRGGRIGAAAALVGSALAVKPILHVVDGQIAALEKVRTSSKALARLEELAVEAAGDGPVDVAVHHLGDAEKAAALAERLRERIGGLRTLYTSEVGAAVGAHTGPGLVGVVVARRLSGEAIGS